MHALLDDISRTIWNSYVLKISFVQVCKPRSRYVEPEISSLNTLGLTYFKDWVKISPYLCFFHLNL